MGLAARTRWTLRRYWADRLGVADGAFDGPGVAVGVADEGGVQVFQHREATVVGAPEKLLDPVERRAGGLAGADGEGEVREWLDQFEAVDRVLGPTFYGYTDRETFTPAGAETRVLRADDEAAYRSLRRSVPDGEWDRGGPAFEPGETVGRFADGTLVAVSGFEVWDGLLAHLGVVAHPDHRGEGHGRAVVSGATEQALAAGLVPQYRTADAWPWSVALAEDLGFRRFATASLGLCRE